MRFDPRDPNARGVDVIETNEPPPDSFVILLDRVIEDLGIEGVPRPYLSAQRASPPFGDDQDAERKRTWTVQLLLDEGEIYEHGGLKRHDELAFIEWHEDRVVVYAPWREKYSVYESPQVAA